MADQSAGARGAPDPRALRHRFPANPTASVSGRVIPLPGPVWLIAASMAVVLLSFANDYGFNRDELYFVLAGRHPDFGYVDQPPLTPLISAAEAALFGLSPLALRVAPAITAAAGVVLSADIARRLGASRTAQVLTALVVAISGWLAVGHVDETTTYDILFWTLALWLLVPLLDDRARNSSADRRRWVALGLVGGLALENKTLAIALPLTVGASLLLLRRWDVLGSRWAWLAATLAAVIWAPNVAWQIVHGFPQIHMAQRIAAEQVGLAGRVTQLIDALLLAGPLLFPVAIAGVVWLLRARESRPWRALGIAVLLQLALMLVVGGKSYYSAGYLLLAIAAGAIPLSRWLERGRRRLRRGTFDVAAFVSGATMAIVGLPLVPVTQLHATRIPADNPDVIGQVGWPQLAAQVSAVVDTLPPAQRANAVIITENYSQYSALTLLGSHLPPVYSGSNSAYDWGRPADGAGPVIVVGYPAEDVEADRPDCHVVATVDNGYGLPTIEQGDPILLCAAPLRPWSELWPELRHLD